ncbi:MAG: diguanylate cyclase [Chloroflexi bacterium]|nr:diguanylate cyclase [Chloroflexota bacterium]
MDTQYLLQNAALEAAANGIVITDSLGRIIWVNSAFTRLTGYTAEEAVGQTTRLLRSGFHDQTFYQTLWQTVLSGQAWHGEMVNRRKDGSLYTEEQTITPVRNGHGEITNFIAVKQDISRRKRAEDMLRRQLDELEVLHTAAVAGAAATDVEALIEQTIQMIGERLYPSGSLGVGLVDEAANVLRIHCFYQGGHQKRTSPLNQGLTGKVLATGQPIRLSRVTRKVDTGLLPGLLSRLCVPLKLGERIVGVIGADNAQEGAFTEADEQLLTTIAGQLAVAIEKLRLYQDAARVAERRAVVYRATEAISASLDLEQVYSAIHQAIVQLMPGEDIVIALLDEQRTELENVYFVEQGERLPSIRYPANRGLGGHIVAAGKSVQLGNMALDMPDIQLAYYDVGQTRSLLAVPLLLKGQAIGMLSAQSYQTNAYTIDDREMLELLAYHAAIAIDNARLFNKVQRLAVIDSLTGLYNRRQFFALAVREFERSRRYHEPLSAIMFDIDYFKRINDTYGHAVGDQVLHLIAEQCQGCMRETDLLGRYGGEEFVVLLPVTDRHNALIGAERLSRCIAQLFISTDVGPLTVTISLGVATMDSTCADVETLLDRADQAMYAAKRAGRNQVKVYEPPA